MLYLCCPYSHPDPTTRNKRFRIASRAAAKLMKSGIVVFSPLSHSVPIAAEFGGSVTLDLEFWMLQDLPILRRCDEILLLGLSGWQNSHGVRQEIFEALSLQKPVTMIEEPDIEMLPAIPKTAQHFLTSKIFTEVIEQKCPKNLTPVN